MPVLVPVLFSFAMTFGYALLFLGHVLVSSALGEIDHPRWPEWHPADIAEGICRWFWAALFGVLLGGIPIAFYWFHCGEIDWFDWFVFGELIMLGAGYAQMALAASLLHENIIAANPITVVSSILRLGVAYLRPCLVASITLVLSGLGVWGLFYKLPSMWMEAVALWGLLGPDALRRDGHAADDGTDVPRSRARPVLVPAQTAVGVVAASRADLRQFVSPLFALRVAGENACSWSFKAFPACLEAIASRCAPRRESRRDLYGPGR